MIDVGGVEIYGGRFRVGRDGESAWGVGWVGGVGEEWCASDAAEAILEGKKISK